MLKLAVFPPNLLSKCKILQKFNSRHDFIFEKIDNLDNSLVKCDLLITNMCNGQCCSLSENYFIIFPAKLNLKLNKINKNRLKIYSCSEIKFWHLNEIYSEYNENPIHKLLDISSLSSDNVIIKVASILEEESFISLNKISKNLQIQKVKLSHIIMRKLGYSFVKFCPIFKIIVRISNCALILAGTNQPHRFCYRM